MDYQQLLVIANAKIENFLHNLVKELKIEYISSMNNQSCTFPLSTGPRKGQECGSKIRDQSKFCKRHQLLGDKFASSQDQTPSVSSSGRIIVDDSSDSETDEIEHKKETKISKDAIIIRKNKFNNFVYEKTDYIFKGVNEKFIVAKEGLNGEWCPLTEEDKKICKNYGLRCRDIPFTKKPSFDKEFLKEIKLPYEVENRCETNKPKYEEVEIKIRDLKLT